MTTNTVALSNTEHDTPIDTHSKTLFGFWVYVMTDCILFGTLFAAYIVLQGSTYGGPSAKELFHLPFALAETVILLTSSFTCGLILLAANRNSIKAVLNWSLVTFALGAAFLALELSEFFNLVKEGHSWQASAFLSAFFTLVATHGLHITMGLLWIIVLAGQIVQRGLTKNTIRRLGCFGIFWHFLDVVWIFIFTIVYLIGAI